MAHDNNRMNSMSILVKFDPQTLYSSPLNKHFVAVKDRYVTYGEMNQPLFSSAKTFVTIGVFLYIAKKSLKRILY